MRTDFLMYKNGNFALRVLTKFIPPAAFYFFFFNFFFLFSFKKYLGDFLYFLCFGIKSIAFGTNKTSDI